MLTFYPGPSKIYPQVGLYLQEAFQSGILSVNHRSAAGMNLVETTVDLLHQKLGIPDSYHIAFVSSATECWEIIAQSLMQTHALHAYTGAFGEKWADYTEKLGITIQRQSFGINEEIVPKGTEEILCLTHNETSNGTQISMDTLRGIRQSFDGLIALDATSSMAGVAFDWLLGDVWFASVQKCFGLPPGLGLFVYGPNALQRAQERNERNHYNSLLFIHENVLKNQTQYTPNLLGIYLLKRVLEQLPELPYTAAAIRQRGLALSDFIETQTDWQLLVKNAAVRSDTVLAITGEPEAIQQFKQRAVSQGITVGNGYGKWKDTTFRIANFPALTDEDFRALRTVFAS